MDTSSQTNRQGQVRGPWKTPFQHHGVFSTHIRITQHNAAFRTAILFDGLSLREDRFLLYKYRIVGLAARQFGSPLLTRSRRSIVYAYFAPVLVKVRHAEDQPERQQQVTRGQSLPPGHLRLGTFSALIEYPPEKPAVPASRQVMSCIVAIDLMSFISARYQMQGY